MTCTSDVFELLHSQMVNRVFSHQTQPSSSEKASEALGSASFDSTQKLDYMGFRVGFGLINRLSKEVPRISSELDKMRFLCREFWPSVFKKPVDNLRTNHQGMYVVQDNEWLLLRAVRSQLLTQTTLERHAAFTCGLVRGALAGLDMPCVAVQVDNTFNTPGGLRLNISLAHNAQTS